MKCFKHRTHLCGRKKKKRRENEKKEDKYELKKSIATKKFSCAVTGSTNSFL